MIKEGIKMKKIRTSLLAASMAMTMTIPVFAETESQEFVIAEQGNYLS